MWSEACAERKRGNALPRVPPLAHLAGVGKSEDCTRQVVQGFSSVVCRLDKAPAHDGVISTNG